MTPPLSAIQKKDKVTIFEYVNSIMSADGVRYFPSGVAVDATNPWDGDLAADRLLGGITVCSICNGANEAHEDCIRNHMIACAGMRC